MARAIQALCLPSLWIGLASLASLAVVLLLFAAEQDARYLIPCMVGLFWGLGTYSFIVTFRAVPGKPKTPLRRLGKLKYIITRLWYGLIAVIFIGGTAAILVITIRMVLIWLRDYGG
jgi:hypothetical protein